MLNTTSTTPAADGVLSRMETREVRLTVPSVLLMGPPGSGKSDVIITALEAGKKVFVISTEGNGLDTLIESYQRRKKEALAKKQTPPSIKHLHWAQVTPVPLDVTTMKIKAGISNANSVGQMQSLEQGLMRNKYPQFMNLLRLLEKMKSDRTGEEFGNIATLTDEWVVCIDSLTGLNTMIIQHVKGIRPTMTQPEYGVVQEHCRDLINMLCSISCFFILTSHVERETNEITGIEKIAASTVGKKLSQQLPAYFSEVIRTYADNDGFWWSTLDAAAEVKARSLPRAAKIIPSFVPIIESYERRKATAQDFETL